jgi:hypothetical protein
MIDRIRWMKSNNGACLQPLLIYDPVEHGRRIAEQ